MRQAQPPHHVLLVAPPSAIRRRMAAAVRKAFPNAHLFPAATAEEAARCDVSLRTHDLALVYADDGNAADVDFLTYVKHRWPTAKIAVFTAREDTDAIIGWLNIGVVGYIPISCPQPLVIAALQLISCDGVFLPLHIVPHLLTSLPAAAQVDGLNPESFAHHLTHRQRQVLRLLLEGHSNSQVADELHISVGTVKQHTHAIYEAVDASSRAELFALAARGGIRHDGSPITVVV